MALITFDCLYIYFGFYAFQVVISYKSGKRVIPLKPHLYGLGRALASGEESTIAEAAIKLQVVYQQLVNKVLGTITKEIQGLCTKSNPSVLRRTDLDSLNTFDWKTVQRELEDRNLNFYSF